MRKTLAIVFLAVVMAVNSMVVCSAHVDADHEWVDTNYLGTTTVREGCSLVIYDVYEDVCSCGHTSEWTIMVSSVTDHTDATVLVREWHRSEMMHEYIYSCSCGEVTRSEQDWCPYEDPTNCPLY